MNAIQVLKEAHAKSENIYIETSDEQSPIQPAEEPGSDDAGW